MAKDPAFLFYSQDFYTGVATLNWEDRGKYISLICLMHQQGRLSEETIRFLVGSVSDNLKVKFRIDENGLWYNERLEQEAAKRNKFTESRRLNGLEGGRPKSKIDNIKPQVDQWLEMVNFFDNSCLCCGYKFPENEHPTKDHVIPTACGGTDTIDNWQPLCRQCNSSKGAQSTVDYREKYRSKIPKKYQTIWFAKSNLMEDENENDTTKALAIKKESFKKEVYQVGELIYTRQMLDNFVAKWTETSRGKNPKMKFEKEKTFEVSLRLATWARNNFDKITCYLTDDQRTIKQKQYDLVASMDKFKEKYSKETMNAFYAYWSMPENKKEPKFLRWELEEFWDLGQRLSAWNSSPLNKHKEEEKVTYTIPK